MTGPCRPDKGEAFAFFRRSPKRTLAKPGKTVYDKQRKKGESAVRAERKHRFDPGPDLDHANVGKYLED